MTVQWGLLSTAHINRKIIPAITQSAQGNLLGVASRSQSKAHVYADEWKIPRAYGSYEELLADKEINVVYISVPNHLHAEWIIKCLQADKHVLCEKPMCLSLEELEAVKMMSDQTGYKVMEAFMHLHHPQTHLWKSIVDTGVLGEIQHIRSSFTSTLDRSIENYRWDPDAGGGALWDIGVYPVSLIQYLYGASPNSVFGSMYTEGGVDVSTSAMLDFGQGRSAQLFVSFRSTFSTDTMIQGSAGQLYISHPYTNVDQCKAYIRRGNVLEHLDVPRQYLYSGEIAAMHDLIIDQKIPNVTLEVSRNVLSTILKIKIR